MFDEDILKEFAAKEMWNAIVENTEFLDRDLYGFQNNAVLNNLNHADNWVKLSTSNVYTEKFISATNNYWGTENEKLIQMGHEDLFLQIIFWGKVQNTACVIVAEFAFFQKIL